MKQIGIYIGLCLLLCVVSCTEEEVPANRPAGSGRVMLTVTPPEQKGSLSRALFPLGPEMENPIKTLSLLVFDRENQHIIADEKYYRYQEVANEDAPGGQLIVETPAYPDGEGYLSDQSVTLCAVANIDRDHLLNAMREKVGAGGVISLSRFKELIVDLPYYERQDSVGLVKNIYMFGYYEGKLRPEGEAFISISMGRIITRLNLSLSLSEELRKMTGMKYAIRLKNTSRKAYIFPGTYSPEEVDTDKYFYAASLAESPVTFYYYVGPHYAKTEDEATQLEIVYGKELPEAPVFPDDENWDAGDEVRRISVPICNDPPEVEKERDCRINRNCVYSIGIHLKKKGGSASASRGGLPAGCYEVEIDAE